MALLYQRVLSMLKTQHQCHDVIPQHRAATGRSLMWSWCHILNCPCRGSAASRSVTSDPQLAIRDIQSDNKMAGVSRCRDRPRAISSWREETLMLAPLPLRPLVSTSRNPARMESALAAWCCQQTARAAFSSRRHWKLYLVVLQCQHAHAARPDAIIYPIRLAEEDQGRVECHVSYIQ
jgi:hypothetical protein